METDSPGASSVSDCLKKTFLSRDIPGDFVACAGFPGEVWLGVPSLQVGLGIVSFLGGGILRGRSRDTAGPSGRLVSLLAELAAAGTSLTLPSLLDVGAAAKVRGEASSKVGRVS